MLSATLDTSNALRSYMARARRWLALAKTRMNCADSYGDLLLATMEFGTLRAMAADQGLSALAEVDQLMAELLEWSHELRVRCARPIG